MREFIVKTNFGHTYKWSPERIAVDYADTALQWQDEDDDCVPKTREELYQEIVTDEDFLTQWFNDYIRGDVSYSVSQAELIAVDQEEYDMFVKWAIDTQGREV